MRSERPPPPWTPEEMDAKLTELRADPAKAAAFHHSVGLFIWIRLGRGIPLETNQMSKANALVPARKGKRLVVRGTVAGWA